MLALLVLLCLTLSNGSNDPAENVVENFKLLDPDAKVCNRPMNEGIQLYAVPDTHYPPTNEIHKGLHSDIFHGIATIDKTLCFPNLHFENLDPSNFKLDSEFITFFYTLAHGTFQKRKETPPRTNTRRKTPSNGQFQFNSQLECAPHSFDSK